MTTPLAALILTTLTGAFVLAVAFAFVARIIFVIERAQNESERLRRARVCKTSATKDARRRSNRAALNVRLVTATHTDEDLAAATVVDRKRREDGSQ